MGYNHDYMAYAAATTEFDEYLLQKPLVQRYPPYDYYERIRKVLAKLAPEGISDLVLTGTSAEHALEVAIRNAVLMFNRGKNISILTFDKSSNGRSLATLALSQEMNLMKTLPSIETVSVELPVAKLPISLHEVENDKKENEALEKIKRLIESRMNNKPIAAIVVEPIQNRGNNFATYKFYKNLRKLAKTQGIYFIINEIHTGVGTTGKFWASDFWNMDDTGDFLVFGKKCQVAGYYTKISHRLQNPFELTDDWNDIGWRLVQLEAVINAIENRDLIYKIGNTGAYLRAELEKIATRRKFIENVRGQGAFIGFDIIKKSYETTKLMKFLRAKGINVKLCDENTIGLRPALILEPIHVSFLIRALNEYPYKEIIRPLK